MNLSRIKRLPFAYAIVLAVAVVCVSLVVAMQNHYQTSYNEFRAQADNIREEIAKHLGKIEQISRMLSYISDDGTGEQSTHLFLMRSHQALQQNSEIDYIAYAQRVSDSNRSDFETQMQESRHPNFAIIEKGINEYQIARIRDQYFVIREFEPIREAVEQILGLDIYASAVYRNGILKALQSGEQVVVQPLHIFNDAEQGFVYVDLSRHAVETSNNMAKNPWSGVSGAVLIKVNLSRLLAGVSLPDNWKLSYSDRQPDSPSLALVPKQLSYSFSPQLVNYYNRIFITLRAPLSFRSFVNSSLAVTGIIALLVSLICVFIVRFVMHRTDMLLANNRKVQAMVDAKTKELQDEKLLLHAEMEERHRLEKQSIYFGRILDQTSNEIYMFSVETMRFVKVNQGALRNLGYTMDEMKNMTPADIKPEYDLDTFKSLVQPLIDGTQNRLVFDTKHMRKDGTTYSVEVRVQIVQGEESVFVAVIEDISERLTTIDKMRKLSSALEASGDIVFITDRSGIIEYVNPAFESATGYRAADALGRRPSLLNSFKQDPAFYENLWSTITRGDHYSSVIINRKKSGELYYEEKTITPIRNESGEICNFVSTGRDITEREMARQQMQEKNKQLEIEIIERESVQAELRKHRAHLSELVDQRTLELAKARDEAIEANSAKTRFLMSMSHELRTPLNAIIGYSELIKDELSENGLTSYLGDVEKITLSGQHLLGLINDLLDLSRVEVGKLELESAEFSVADLIRSVEYAVQPLMAKNSNQFEINIEDENIRMIGDVKRVRQVLVNLVANAGKFTENGKVSLFARVIDDGGNQGIEFKVVDTGIGIADDKINLLFQEFSQTDASIANKYGGTGLGLAISKKLCESMGGDICVNSQSGWGSEFVVNLPLTINDEDAPQMAAAQQ